MAGLRPGFDSQLAQGARDVTSRRRPEDGADIPARRSRLRQGASWLTVSSNVKRLMRAWEEDGAIDGNRLPTRKDAIRHAVNLCLREAKRIPPLNSVIRQEDTMPERKTQLRAARDRKQGKSPGTQAGEYVREEIEHVREGKHGARSAKQAIAIGLSKARRAGVKLPAPPAGKTSAATRRKAEHDLEAARRPHHASAKRSRAVSGALAREPHVAASPGALSRHAHAAARRRTQAERSASARQAARTRARRRTGA